jgi:thioredoxin reductase (NADPH)
MNTTNTVDILIIGGGPVGLACGVEAVRHGLSHVILEKGCIVNSLNNWPTFTTFFSTAELLEIGDMPFVTNGAKPTRKESLVYYRKVAERCGLNVHQYEAATDVAKTDIGFTIKSTKATYAAKYVIVATGFFDKANLLGIDGEDLPKVSHYYKEPFAFYNTDVLVIGGKNSAVEAALDLHRNGAKVTMAVRKPDFGQSVKYWLKPDIENRVKEGSIKAYFNTTVEAITPESVVLNQRGEKTEIKNDFVFALTGYRPDFDFLSKLGIQVTPDLHLVYNEQSMETTVAGLYLAGVVAAGIDIGKLFIENGRIHAKQIISHILQTRGQQASATMPAVRKFQDGD